MYSLQSADAAALRDEAERRRMFDAGRHLVGRAGRHHLAHDAVRYRPFAPHRRIRLVEEDIRRQGEGALLRRRAGQQHVLFPSARGRRLLLGRVVLREEDGSGGGGSVVAEVEVGEHLPRVCERLARRHLVEGGAAQLEAAGASVGRRYHAVGLQVGLGAD